MIIDYLLLFYDDKPIDWLISDFFKQKTCQISPKDCSNEFFVPYNRGLFQHIGSISSLAEKMSKMKQGENSNLCTSLYVHNLIDFHSFTHFMFTDTMLGIISGYNLLQTSMCSRSGHTRFYAGVTQFLKPI